VQNAVAKVPHQQGAATRVVAQGGVAWARRKQAQQAQRDHMRPARPIDLDQNLLVGPALMVVGGWW